jgi:leader peptidase (prepilin peptidase) / N-methyltransferase
MESLLFAAPQTLAAAIAAGVFGLLIGSFLNVVIHRLPKMMEREYDQACAEHMGKELPPAAPYNLVVPRSACPHCQHQITAMENIPVISYLALGGKCKGCKAKISPRYPIIELVTGALAALAVWTFGSGWTGLGAMVFMFLLVAMTCIDLDTMMLPDDLTYPLLWLGLLVNLQGAIVPLQDAVIGAVAGYMSLWIVATLYEKVRGQIGMGGGDLKLLGALGAWMGWSMLPAIILLSSVVGAVVGISMILFKGMQHDTRIPFGPYLAGAGLLALLYGPQIMAFQTGILHG